MSSSGLGEWGYSALPSQEPPSRAQPLGGTARGPGIQGGTRRAGEYLLVEHLGDGGMGTIWRGRHPARSGDVAVKLLLQGQSATPRQRERFLTEARAATRLSHPNAVVLHAVGEEAGVPFLVMDLVEGESVGARLKRAGPFPPRDAVRIAARVARALEHAHARRVLHRDVKPSNILLERGRGDEPRLADFGLAKLLDGSREPLTRTGDVLGTPGYMAPEQAKGEADERTDVYSLGATLYAMLTGDPPTTARTLLEFMAQVQQVDAPRLRKARPDLDERLDAIVGWALERDPRRRYGCAAELAEDLDRWLDGLSPLGPATPLAAPPPAGRRRARPLLLVLGLGLASGAGTWLVLRPRGPVPAAVLAEARGHLRARDPAAALAALDRGLLSAPGDPALRAERAGLHLLNGEAARALEDAQVALDAAPQDASACFLMARVRSALGRRQEALELCARALAREPERGEVWLLQGRLRYELGDSATALADVERAVALRAPGALGQRAALRFQLGQRAEALVDLRAAVQEEPHQRELWQRLAQLEGQMGRLPAALEAATRALELDPRDPGGWLQRAEIQATRRAWEEAEIDCNRALELEAESRRALEQRAQVRLARRDLRGALADFSRVVELYPTMAHAWGNRATARLELGDLDGAESDLREAERLEPGNPIFPTSRGAVLQRREDWAGMAQLLDGVLTRHPDFTQALWGRATARGNLGDLQGAREDLDRLLARDPRHQEGFLSRANLSLKEGRHREALADAERVLSLRPRHLDGLALRGFARAYLGLHPQAIEDLRLYLRLAPPDHWRRADVERSLGHLERRR